MRPIPLTLERICVPVTMLQRVDARPDTHAHGQMMDHIAVSPQQPLHRDVAMRSVQRADTLTSAMVTIWRMIAIE